MERAYEMKKDVERAFEMKKDVERAFEMKKDVERAFEMKSFTVHRRKPLRSTENQKKQLGFAKQYIVNIVFTDESKYNFGRDNLGKIWRRKITK